MADLTYFEKQRLERLFRMQGGYVLNFSNRTLQEFVADAIGRDIYASKYMYGSGSKANLIRGFWQEEPNHVVGRLLSEMIDLAEEEGENDQPLIQSCRRIAERLLQGAPVEDLSTLGEQLDDPDLEVVLRPIRASLDANEPEAALDRLHTLATRFLRRFSGKYDIAVPRDKPLHSLMGELIKAMKAAGAIETQMTERILKSTIANLDAFNTVRNERSLAHDNPVLSYEESLFIVNNVVSSLRFIQAVENRRSDPEAAEADDDLPF